MKTGFSAPAGYNSASMDIYVLEGSFSLGDDTLTVGCYTYIPGGMLVEIGILKTGQGSCFSQIKTFEYFPGEKGEIDLETIDHILLWKAGN